MNRATLCSRLLYVCLQIEKLENFHRAQPIFLFSVCYVQNEQSGFLNFHIGIGKSFEFRKTCLTFRNCLYKFAACELANSLRKFEMVNTIFAFLRAVGIAQYLIFILHPTNILRPLKPIFALAVLNTSYPFWDAQKFISYGGSPHYITCTRFEIMSESRHIYANVMLWRCYSYCHFEAIFNPLKSRAQT